MIVAKCPIRISLVGGSTDLQAFLDVHGRGAVISFPCSLHTYISVHENHRSKFIVNYSKQEEVEAVEQIANDVAREALLKFKPARFLTLNFNSDIFSVGSGLAASSSYVVAAIKALSIKLGSNLSDFDICKLALELERKFNPLTGQQDTYGCGMPGFKRINFHSEDDPSFEYLDSLFLDHFDIYTLYTGITRGSTNILKSVSIKKPKSVLNLVDVMHQSIIDKDFSVFLEIINEGWEKKKETSDLIMSSARLVELDMMLQRTSEVLAHKLCGAGGGGYFVIFAKKGTNFDKNSEVGQLTNWLTRVTLSNVGIQATVI